MRRRLAGLAVLGAVAAPAAAPAQMGHDMSASTAATEVTQAFATFMPATIDVVTGDTVRWRNASIRPHTTTADDGTFDSGRMAPEDQYRHRFDAEAVVPYHCTLHATMRGEVRVHDVLLAAPSGAAGPGRAFPLHGRTAMEPGTDVTFEADTGAGYHPVATATVAADRTFEASFVPRASGRVRAVAGGRASPAVRILVLDRTVRATTRLRRGRLTVDVRVTPPSPGAKVVLQLRLKRRFGWWPVQQARLGRSSRARLTTPLRRARPARVVLTLPDGATVLASSGTLRVARR